MRKGTKEVVIPANVAGEFSSSFKFNLEKQETSDHFQYEKH